MYIKNFADLRQLFPIFKSCEAANKNCLKSVQEPFVWFDNAATTQKPQQVLERINHYYSCENASVHRGLYSASERATALYEQARQEIAEFIGAYPDEIIFTKGATESINFVASAWAANNLSQGDEIIISEFEHNSNILPWLHLRDTLGVKVKFIPVDETGSLDYQAYQNLITSQTKLVSITHRANSIGVKVDLEKIINKAHEHKIPVLVDVAQTIVHEKIDVSVMKPEFLVLSAHKLLGPTGIGVLYLSRAMQEYTLPYQRGGGMVEHLDLKHTTWLKSPHKYEAGSPAIAQALGFAEAIKFINNYIDFEAIQLHQKELSQAIITGLEELKNIKLIGPRNELLNSPIISFYSPKLHPHDIAAYLAQFNISVRAGNHCAPLLFKKLGLPGSVRISTCFYNTLEEVDYTLSKLQLLEKNSL